MNQSPDREKLREIIAKYNNGYVDLEMEAEILSYSSHQVATARLEVLEDLKEKADEYRVTPGFIDFEGFNNYLEALITKMESKDE